MIKIEWKLSKRQDLNSNKNVVKNKQKYDILDN